MELPRLVFRGGSRTFLKRDLLGGGGGAWGRGGAASNNKSQKIQGSTFFIFTCPVIEFNDC